MPRFVTFIVCLFFLIVPVSFADDGGHKGHHHHHAPKCNPDRDDYPVFDGDSDDLGCPRLDPAPEVPVEPPAQERAGYCLNGVFLNLIKGQPNTDPIYTEAVPAFYYEGLGITCDVLPGFVATGEFADGSGNVNAGGFYPYFAKA